MTGKKGEIKMPKGKQGGRRDFVRLERDRGDYTPFAIQEVWAEKEARKEYSRLRNIVVKRLKRIEEVEPSAKILRRWSPDTFKPLKEVKNMRELSHLLSDVAYLVNAPTASLKGRENIRKRQMEKLQEMGINIKSKEELSSFGDFMSLVKAWAVDRVYDSEHAASLWDELHETHSNVDILKEYQAWAYKKARTRPRRAR